MVVVPVVAGKGKAFFVRISQIASSLALEGSSIVKEREGSCERE